MIRKDSSGLLCEFCKKPAVTFECGTPVCEDCIGKAQELQFSFSDKETKAE